MSELKTNDLNQGEKLNHPKRGIYLLPNIFTLGAMFFGFYAIISAMSHHFSTAAVAIYLAMLLDGMDGRVARFINAQTDFGAQLDSLSDLISFGLAPAIVLFIWSLSSLGKIGWMAAFFYLVCASLRLARFNSTDESETEKIDPNQKHHFIGLSTTAAAGVVAGFIWVCSRNYIHGDYFNWIVCVFTIIVALLEVSNIPYRSYKDINMRRRVSFLFIFSVVVVLLLIVYDTPDVLLAIFTLYALSGPFLYLKNIKKLRQIKQVKQQT